MAVSSPIAYDLQVVLILAVCILDGADQGLLGATFRSLEESLGLTPAQLGLMGLAQASTMALAGPAWGWLCDSGFASRRQLMSAGALGWGSMMICTGLAKNVSTLVLVRLLNGAFLASLMPLSQGWVADFVAPEFRGATFGYLQSAQAFGGIVSSATTVAIASKRFMVGSASVEGWRLMSHAVGVLSLMLAGVLFALMHDRKEAHKGSDEHSESSAVSLSSGPRAVLENLRNHWRIPSFRTIIAQGVVGSIPWNAMSFETMFLLYLGFEPEQLSFITLCLAPTHILGGIVGGYIGDWAARRSPNHGRAYTAQVSVASGIPAAFVLIVVLPNTVGASLRWYLLVKTFFNLTATWCLAGVNRPLLNDIVDSRCRASIVAWDCALEGTVAAIFGMPFLGFLAERGFGYVPTKQAVAAMAPELRQTNLHALQSALSVMYIVPWLVCFVLYSGLHWTYPRDMRKLKVERKEENDAAYGACISTASSGLVSA
eukprot:TRINITY_DN14783_c0_g2_i1.p1 TRINITY_DN14783_c0_g2~~TRINITY_DN14783_c0_g2_i1.p1  ORF type:complete len:501 (-),score=110.85 TRINITY_DN14783_c0_g2_i1:59-1516(-)